MLKDECEHCPCVGNGFCCIENGEPNPEKCELNRILDYLAKADYTVKIGETKMSQRTEDAKDFARMLRFVAECVDYTIKVSSYPNCNTCGKCKSCKHIPKLGDQVRINCPLWESKNR